MSTLSRRYLVLALLLVLAVSAGPASAKRLDGTFTGVVDANVVVLDYGDGTYDVRIFGIEAPTADQPFGPEALDFVRDRLVGKPGAMRFRYRDADDRMVGRVLYRPGGDPNAPEHDLAVDMVAAGLAWIQPGVKYKAEAGQVDPLTAALRDAKAAGRGIWSQADAVAPWTHRGQDLPQKHAMPHGEPLGTNGNLDRNMSKLSGDDNECAIAKNPLNPMQLVTHCNSLDTPWRSTDGGLTWAVGGALGSYCCDPNLAWDKFGNLYATYINGSVNAIVTKLSTDAGVTFGNLASFSGSVDQPSIVATEITGGNVLVAIVWNQGTMKASSAVATGLGTVGAFSATQDAAAGGSCSFGDLTVSPTGKVIQVCGPQSGQTGGPIVVTVDPDGLGTGLPFALATSPGNTNVGGFDFIPPQNSRSIDSETGVVYDRNPSSPHFGRLYVMYTDEPTQENGDTDIFIRHSDNDAGTWSAATKINTDGATLKSQFLPKISADPATGNIAVCWHDARNSGSNTAMEIWCDTTTPATYPAFQGNTLVSDGASTSNGSGVEFGDYSGLIVGNGSAHPTWADTSNSTGDNPDGNSNFDAYTDQISVLAADFTFGVTPPSLAVCAPANAVYTVNVGAFGGFTDPVDLSVSGQPAGTTTNFSVDPVTPPNTSTLTIGNTVAGTPGPSTITVSGSSSTGIKGVQVSLFLSTAPPGAPTLIAPANSAVDVGIKPVLDWSDATQAFDYDLQIATDAGFTNVVYTRTGVTGSTHTVGTPLATETLHFWRVRASNSCADGGYSTTFSFTTRGIPAVLLVDDDDDGPDVQGTYATGVNGISDFDLWDITAEGGEPTLSDLTPYKLIIWFSGDRFTGNTAPTAGPQAASEAALATYLDGGQGRCVFISSQDYLWDMGGAGHNVPTAFMQNYLGVAAAGNSSDNGDYTSVTGQNIFSGIGPSALSYPFTDFSDRLAVGTGAQSAFVGNNAFTGGVSKSFAASKAFWLAFPWEAMAVADRDAVFTRLFENCSNEIFVDGFEAENMDAWTSHVP